jgi:hypothetical protein
MNPVIAAITKSQKNENIILTTTESYSADFLIQNSQIWTKYFRFSTFYKDREWFKVVLHGIPTEIFNFSEGMKLLKQEIETFNGFYPINVYWISSAENRQSKKHGSVVVSFDSKEIVNKVLKQRLLIAGIAVRTAKFEEIKSSEQCQKCQKFGHSSNSCKNRPICQYCAENHITRLHRCTICEVFGQICIHTKLKCANCSQNHRANSIECEIFAANKKSFVNKTSSERVEEIMKE